MLNTLLNLEDKGKPIYYNWGENDCPICEDNKAGSDCQFQLDQNKRYTSSKLKCHNATTDTEVPDYINPIGEFRAGWSTTYSFKHLTEEMITEFLSLSVGVHKSGFSGFKTDRSGKKIAVDNSLHLSTAERDAGLREMSRSSLLHPIHSLRLDLQRRGLTDKQIDSHCFISPSNAPVNLRIKLGHKFPGFKEESAVGKVVQYFWPAVKTAFIDRGEEKELESHYNYYFIPAYNFDGQVHGGQLGLDPDARAKGVNISKNKKSGKAPKYIAITETKVDGEIYSTRTAEYNEAPLTLLRAKTSSNVLILSEGILKPLVAYERLDQKYHVMGAIGGLFTSSPQNYVANLTLLREREGVNTVVFAVDKCWMDPAKVNVRAAVARALTLAKEMGFSVNTLDFGQAAGDADDIDTAPVDLIHEHIEPYITEKRNLLEDIMLTSVLPAPKDLSFSISETIPVKMLESQQEVLDWYASDTKVKFDLRPMGSGKSHIVPSLLPAGEGGKVYYVSSSPRMVPTPEIHNKFIPMPSCHSGLVEQKGRINAVGEPLSLRPKPTDDPSTYVGATCAKPEAVAAASRLGLHGNSVCKTCEFADGCRSGDGPYTYLYDKKVAMSASHIRTSIDGLNPDAVTENDTIVIDEVTASVPFVEISQFSSLQVRSYLDQMNQNFKGLNVSFSSDGVITHDLSHGALISAAVALDMKLAKRIDGQLSSGVPVTAVAALAEKFVRACTQEGSRISVDYSGVTVMHRTNKVKNLVAAAGKVILSDATASPTILAAQYGIDPKQCSAITMFDKAIKSVKVIAHRAEGLNSRANSSARETLCTKIRSTFDALCGDKVGYISHGEYAKPGDIRFFSDHRGSNMFKDKKAVVIFGLPNPSVIAMQIEFDLLSTSLPEITFQDYYNYKTHGETKQCIGRTRGYQREDEELEVHIVANVHLTQLEKEGYSVEYKSADLEFDCKTNTNSAKSLATLTTIFEGIRSNACDSLAALCKKMGWNRYAIERTLRRIGLDFSYIHAAATTPIKPGNWDNSFPQPIVEAAKKCVVDDIPLDLDVFPVEMVVRAARSLSTGLWPSGAKREHVQKIQLAFGVLAGARQTDTWATRLKEKVLPGLRQLCPMGQIVIDDIGETLKGLASGQALTNIQSMLIMKGMTAMEVKEYFDAITFDLVQFEYSTHS
jgi:hypothetical protein